jgi:hypothetical protein
MNVSAVINKTDEYFSNQNNTPNGYRPAVSKLDFTVTYRPNDGDWRLIASCNNCTDERNANSTLDFGTLGFVTQFQDMPRLWRVSYRYDF